MTEDMAIIGEEAYRAAKEILEAAQCCEHLNRALIMEQDAAEKYGYFTLTKPPHSAIP